MEPSNTQTATGFRTQFALLYTPRIASILWQLPLYSPFCHSWCVHTHFRWQQESAEFVCVFWKNSLSEDKCPLCSFVEGGWSICLSVLREWTLGSVFERMKIVCLFTLNVRFASVWVLTFYFSFCCSGKGRRKLPFSFCCNCPCKCVFSILQDILSFLYSFCCVYSFLNKWAPVFSGVLRYPAHSLLAPFVSLFVYSWCFLLAIVFVLCAHSIEDSLLLLNVYWIEFSSRQMALN